ncbi:uncharacterized protein LAESUDRAFT_719021 [Laetiporus sulphureus 93-53]|uniref:Cyanovirin-N domain-containing protein n=1 Tax=Laetiporus sulphureus 93-53 TaxID=1314785 RepID=A0A165I8F0_9APHY|nr:uncharacterized protein LAESUDRAFT_719021 [Laetiporus sulphureus 93-53]KZT12726.1 hypothetical protein LAESUDRAFT_719021 [Laetiporus sulphureus 93-53]
MSSPQVALILLSLLIVVLAVPWDSVQQRQRETARQQWEVTWAKEKEQLEKERHTWELAWSLEKEQREKEQMNDEKCFCSDERPFGLNWEGLQGHHCISYGWREYTARLFSDGCPHIPLSISGKKKEVPYKCTSERSRKMGHWILADDVCRTNWGELYDRGCVANGKHRYEARLVNVRAGDDWERMCSSTPATIAGEYFPIPTFCENRGLFEMGVWDTKDPRCK